MANRKAFTLIELLVVIAIIALLVSILLPSLNKAKELAREVVCLTQLRTIGLSENLYAQDNDGMIIYTRADGFTDHCTYWASYIWEQMNHNLASIRKSGNPVTDVQCLRCPVSAPDEGWNDALRDGTQYLQGITYTRNSFDNSKLWWISNGSLEYPGISLGDFKAPGETPDVADGTYIHALGADSFWDMDFPDYPEGQRRTSYRHVGLDSLNILMWDGHAVNEKDSVTDKYHMLVD